MKLTRRQFLRGLALLPWVTLPSLARAQEPVEHKVYLPILGADMAELAFPCTGILDDFSGADFGPPPGPNWSSVPPNHMLVRLGNQCARNPAEVGIGIAIWTSPTTANCEAYKTISTLMDDGSYSEVFARANPSDMSGAYFVAANRDDAGGDTVTISSDLTPGTLATYSIVLQAGDSIGIRCCTNRISAYHRPVGGSWLLLGTVVNSDNLASGCIGMDVDGDNERDDDFGGGSISDACCGIETVVVTTVVTKCAEDPSLALVCANGDRLDLITWESGFELDDPGWRPQIAQFKGGGSYANSQIAEGQTLVAGEYDNVVETIPLVARGTSEAKCIQTYRRLQQFIKRASDYWKEPSEYDDVWLEVRPAGLGCRIGYARVVKASCVDFSNPFGQPFFSQQALSVADGLSLVVEREPLWRAVPPGELIGPLYNLLKNPDFEEWNSGVADSQPDCWSDVEIGAITGTNARDTAGPKWGRAALTVDVTNSTGAGQAKGVTQVAEGTEDGQEYTLVAWVRNAGVTGGVGRLLVTSLLGQYEVYRSGTQHGWTLYTETFTVGIGDVVGVNCEILSTDSGTDGTVYFDSLMLLKGDWEQEAIDGMLPYMTSSHIVNHWDTGAGHLNYVDAWEVPGDDDALVRLEIMNATIPSNLSNVVEVFSHIRIGQRRVSDITQFMNYLDPAGSADATASNGDRVSLSITTSWMDMATLNIIGPGTTKSNAGRFRVIARAYDAKGSGDPTLRARLRYWRGAANVNVKTLSEVPAPSRATWCTLDLTDNAALVWDEKFMANSAGMLGATIQFKRNTGTANAYLDYLMLLPTDGGFLNAELGSGLMYGDGLVADNTASMQISGMNLKVGWRQDHEFRDGATWDSVPYDLLTWHGLLYHASANLLAGNGRVWRRDGSTWTKVFTGGDRLRALADYDGYLYVAGNSAALGGPIYRTLDGLSWALVGRTTDQVITCMQTYAGILYIASNTPNDTIYSWNGTLLAAAYNLPAGDYGTKMTVYRGLLYVGTNIGHIYSFDGAAWQLVYNIGAAVAISSMQVFNDKLYAGSANNGLIYVFDGSAWTTVATGLGSVNALTVFEEELYAAGVLAGAAAAQVLVSSDGVSFIVVYEPTSYVVFDLESYLGELYLATAVLGDPTIIYRLAINPNEYVVTNYQGSPFTAPNRRLLDDSRRHRWVVSYDRSDGSNNISDEALVGLGYVPRYLALLGEG